MENSPWSTGALKNGYHYCMHGLGAIKGLRQTNTLEAFLLWYKKGVRIFEFDIAETDDGRYVAAAHTVDKKSLLRMEITEEPDSYSFSWFMEQKLFPMTAGGLSPLSLEMIAELLEKYEDCIFMLDLFGMFTASKTVSFLNALGKTSEGRESIADRLLIEAYNTEMSGAMLSFEKKFNIIFCIRHEFCAEGESAAPIGYLKENRIGFISYPWQYTKLFPGELKEYADAGITVFSRTKYNTKDKELKKSGVSVNIIGFKFDGPLIIVQYPFYILECVKRAVSKIRIRKMSAGKHSGGGK